MTISFATATVLAALLVVLLVVRRNRQSYRGQWPPYSESSQRNHAGDAVQGQEGVEQSARGDVAIFFRKTTPPFEAAVHWVFSEDLDRTYNELKSLGANIVEPLEKKPWGLRQFTVEDIDGNRFYFHHH